MTDRPDLVVMWHLAFDDEKLRLRPGARTALLDTCRCPRRNHSQAFVLRSVYGTWVAWRPIVRARDVWQQDWLDLMPDEIEVTCHCDDTRPFDVSPYRALR